MAYLSYLIDNYVTLPAISLFLHAHRTSWHDNLFGLDAPSMLRRVNLSRVLDQSYTNLRCGWAPGCPAHIRPGEGPFDAAKPEQIIFGEAWAELFPLAEVPEVLSQPCCAQFAVTAETVRRRTRAEYVFWRDWLLGTELEDEVSGRVMEYVYQCGFSFLQSPLVIAVLMRKGIDIFTGSPVHCLSEEDCYCSGYSMCFDQPGQFRTFINGVNRWNELNALVNDEANSTEPMWLPWSKS